MLNDDPPPEFLKIDFDRGRPQPTFNAHIGALYVRRGGKGTRDEFVMGFRVHQHMCNPAGGLHGGMMMTVADLVGAMGGGTLAGLRKFLPTVNMTFDFVAPATLDALRGRTKLAVVTNCSVRLGAQAAGRLNTSWDCIVTAEEVGFYKPDPRPYRLALAKLGIEPRDAAFVAGSGYDLFGTSAVGLRTYWHNRVGLTRPDGAPAASLERPTLEGLLPWLEGPPL